MIFFFYFLCFYILIYDFISQDNPFQNISSSYKAHLRVVNLLMKEGAILLAKTLDTIFRELLISVISMKLSIKREA